MEFCIWKQCEWGLVGSVSISQAHMHTEIVPSSLSAYHILWLRHCLDTVSNGLFQDRHGTGLSKQHLQQLWFLLAKCLSTGKQFLLNRAVSFKKKKKKTKKSFCKEYSRQSLWHVKYHPQPSSVINCESCMDTPCQELDEGHKSIKDKLSNQTKHCNQLKKQAREGH